MTVSGQQGYSLRSSDGNFQIRFRGYIQSDGRFVGDSDTTSGPSTFVMRRVRPVIEATAFKIFDFKLMPDFGGGTTVLQDAYADAKFATWFRVRAGKYKAPFGLVAPAVGHGDDVHRARHADADCAEPRPRRDGVR